VVSDQDMLKHELAHAIGCLIAGAEAVKIILREDHAETVPAWPGNVCSDEQLLSGLIAGRAHVVAGMSTVLDEDQIQAADPEAVERIAAKIMPEVVDRLECVTIAEINAMLSALAEDGALLITPLAVH
jgi:hypothetical protein